MASGKKVQGASPSLVWYGTGGATTTGVVRYRVRHHHHWCGTVQGAPPPLVWYGTGGATTTTGVVRYVCTKEIHRSSSRYKQAAFISLHFEHKVLRYKLNSYNLQTFFVTFCWKSCPKFALWRSLLIVPIIKGNRSPTVKCLVSYWKYMCWKCQKKYENAFWVRIIQFCKYDFFILVFYFFIKKKNQRKQLNNRQ